jgi:hypothetical protein
MKLFHLHNVVTTNFLQKKSEKSNHYLSGGKDVQEYEIFFWIT